MTRGGRLLMRLLACVPLLAGGACAADAVAGPSLAPEPEVAANDEAPPQLVIVCRLEATPPPTEPLYIVDGAAVPEVDAQRRIDAGNVEIELLTGFAATSIYGTRAAQGVVIVTTRASTRSVPGGDARQ